MIFAILGVAIYFLLPRVTEAKDAFTIMVEGNYWLLGLAVLLEVCSFLGYGYLTRFVFHSLRAELDLWLVLRINLAGFAASRIFSVGGIGGFVVTYQALAKRGVSRSIAVIAVATQQFFTYIVLWIIFFSALVYLSLRGKGSAGGVTFAIVCIGLILVHLAYFIYLYNRPTVLRRRARQLVAMLNRVRRRMVIPEAAIDDWVDRLRAGIRPMTARRGAIRMNVLYASLWWIFDILCLFTVFGAYGYRISLGPLLMAYSVAYTVATFVPTPGGLGTVEALLLALFAGFGVPSGVSVATVLVYRLINFWLPIPFGTAAYLTIRRADRKGAGETTQQNGGPAVNGNPAVNGRREGAEAGARATVGAEAGASGRAATGADESGLAPVAGAGGRDGGAPVAVERGGAPVAVEGGLAGPAVAALPAPSVDPPTAAGVADADAGQGQPGDGDGSAGAGKPADGDEGAEDLAGPADDAGQPAGERRSDEP